MFYFGEGYVNLKRVEEGGLIVLRKMKNYIIIEIGNFIKKELEI